MRSARWFFAISILTLILAGIFVDYWFAGLLLAGGLGALFGSLNAFLGGLNE